MLSRGLFSEATLPTARAPGEIRSRMPRFTGENFERNRALVAALGRIAKVRGITVAQLAFAWLRTRGADIVPLIGARTRAQLSDALGGLDLVLTDFERAAIERALPKDAVAGERYGPLAMKHLDSELAG